MAAPFLVKPTCQPEYLADIRAVWICSPRTFSMNTHSLLVPSGCRREKEEVREERQV